MSILQGFQNYIPAKIVPVLVGLLSISFYTRLMTPEEYGQYILVMTAVSTVNAFGFNWIGYVIWRYFPKVDSNEFADLLSALSSIVLLLFATISAAGCLIFFLITKRTDLPSYFRLGIAVLLTQIVFSLTLEILRTTRQSKRYNLNASLMSLGTFVLALSFFSISIPRTESLLLALTLVGGTLSFKEILWITRQWRIRLFHFSGETMKKVFSFGLPQIGVAGSASILAIGDRYLVKAFLGSQAVGTYAAGYTMADYGIQLPLSILMLSALPVIVTAYEKKGDGEAAHVLRRVISIYFVVLLAGMVGLIALSHDMVHLLLGKSFQNAGAVLPWVAAGIFFFGLTQSMGMPFQLKEKPMIPVYLLFFSALLNLSLNCFVIPRYGIVGAAFATFAAYFIYAAALYLLVRKIFPSYIPWDTVGRSTLAAFGMYIGLVWFGGRFAFSWTLIPLKILFGAAVYIGLMMLLREPTLEAGFRFLRSQGK